MTACAGVAAWAAWAYLPASYEARSLLHVATPPVAPDWRQYDLDLADRLISSYVALAESRRVEAAVMEALGLAEAPRLRVEAVPNSNLMEAVGRAATPQAAADAANELVSALTRLGIEMGMADPEAGIPHRLAVVEAAAPPAEPLGPSLPLLITLALLGGAALGLLLAFVAENLDRRLHFVEDVAVLTGRPALAVVPRGKASSGPTIAPSGSAQARAYRRLGAQLLARNGGAYPPVLMFVSAQPSAGVAAVAFNLAKVMATGGKQVLVVDCSRADGARTAPRRSSGSIDDGQASARGRSAAMVIQATKLNRVKLLVEPPERLADLLPELVGRYDVVLVDAGALSVDATPLASAQPDVGVVLVVRLGSDTAEYVVDARDQLATASAYALGTVITNARAGSYRIDVAVPEPGTGWAGASPSSVDRGFVVEPGVRLRPEQGLVAPAGLAERAGAGPATPRGSG